MAGEKGDYVGQGQAWARTGNDALVIAGGIAGAERALVEGTASGVVVEGQAGRASLSIKRPPIDLMERKLDLIPDNDFGPLNRTPTLASQEMWDLRAIGERERSRADRGLNLNITERGLLAQEREQAAAAGWKRPNGNTWWPPYDGAIPGTQRMVTLEPSVTDSPNLIDRFGRTAGTFVSPAGASLESRALSSTPNGLPSIYSVERPIGNVERAGIAPWFGQKGLGVQYNLPNSVQYYLDTEKIKEVAQ